MPAILTPPRLVLENFTSAIRAGDWAETRSVLAKVESRCLLRQACLKIRRLPYDVPPEVSAGFHSFWTERGHRIREAIADDALLLDALRILLPPYRGPSRLLYRGESAQRRRQRRYGSAWTEDPRTARMFASGLNAVEPEGGVLLRAEAASEAIIAAPSSHSVYLGEGEYVVDRRRLGKISVIARFPAIRGNT